MQGLEVLHYSDTLWGTCHIDRDTVVNEKGTPVSLPNQKKNSYSIRPYSYFKFFVRGSKCLKKEMR